MSASVTLHNVTISYDRHPAVHHLSGEFAAGSLTAIAGPNGAGKSTLLKAIAGLIVPDGGQIHIHGIRRDHIAYLPQAAELERSFPLTVMHLVASGAWHMAGGFSTITPAMKERAHAALHTVGLKECEKRSLTSLSAGQFQRALFARLLMQDSALLLLDEPFNAIDADSVSHLLEVIKQWHNEQRTVICVLHDFDQIRSHFPRCLLMARECIAWDSSAKALSQENLQKARVSYGQIGGSHPEICVQGT